MVKAYLSIQISLPRWRFQVPLSQNHTHSKPPWRGMYDHSCSTHLQSLHPVIPPDLRGSKDFCPCKETLCSITFPKDLQGTPLPVQLSHPLSSHAHTSHPLIHTHAHTHSLPLLWQPDSHPVVRGTSHVQSIMNQMALPAYQHSLPLGYAVTMNH